jgi:hypothetical protein
MVERLERGAGDELRDEREHPGALVVGDVSAGDDDDEVGDRSRNDRDDDQQREVARIDQAREHTNHYQHNRAGSSWAWSSEIKPLDRASADRAGQPVRSTTASPWVYRYRTHLRNSRADLEFAGQISDPGLS